MIKGPDAIDVLDLMADSGVLAEVLPEAGPTDRLDRLCWLETAATGRESVRADETRRLAALIDLGHDGAGAAMAIAERLKFSNRERLRLVRAVAPGWTVDPAAPPEVLAQALHRLGADSVRDVALLRWAEELTLEPRLARERTDGWFAILDRIDAWRPVAFPLHGRDALALGIPRGPRVGALLRCVEDWWEAGGCGADRDACLARLAEEVASASSDGC
jgi:poly(A) polymerase